MGGEKRLRPHIEGFQHKVQARLDSTTILVPVERTVRITLFRLRLSHWGVQQGNVPGSPGTRLVAPASGGAAWGPP